MGTIGFDGVWIENEHSDFSYGEISQMILAARANDMDSIVRVERSGYTGIIKPLEAGATGIIVPQIIDGEDAKSIVREAKYSPIGLRGSGGSTDAGFGTQSREEYINQSINETFVAALIENPTAVEDVDAIASTEGIDILLLGPGDLSQSYGIFGQSDHHLIKKATDKIAQACEKYGKWWGAPIANRQEAEAMLEKGGRFVQTVNDQEVLVSAFRSLIDSYKDM
tara:strand:+ start:32368 stop:33039 length:672 start_codon:yes stop_codon:yes gene_type:complete